MSELVTAEEIEDATRFRYPAGSQIEKLYNIGLEIRARVKKLDQYGVKAVDMVDLIEHLLKDAEALCDADGFEAFKKTYCSELGQSRTYELSPSATAARPSKKSDPIPGCASPSIAPLNV